MDKGVIAMATALSKSHRIPDEDTEQHYRLDVIFEGALDYTENFDEDSVWTEWNTQLEDLEENCMDKDWSLSVYDEREYPPRLVTEHRNDPQEDSDD